MIRRVIVTVISNLQSLTQKNALLDVSLLRAAHRALLRLQSGITDAFLFIFCGGELAEEEATAAVAPYAFPAAQVICISTKDEDGDEIYEDDLSELIGEEISRWIKTHHPSAITSLYTGGYDIHGMWWSGVEATDSDWDFLEEYAETLPDSHREKARTWLAILKDALELDDPIDWLDENDFSLYAATLCEWLHGFEVASGNGFNQFEADSVGCALKIDDFYLGHLLCQIEGTTSLRDIFDECDTDFSSLRSYALNRATEEKRSTVRRALVEFFGSDTALFWALHTTIWPKFTEPSATACHDLVNPNALEDIAEVMESWEFVTNGWTDAADS